MIESILFVFLGLALLILGGEFLVQSASKLAAGAGISPLVVGLTVVAFGTSAPELGVSLFAALRGNPEIALSNVVGSNIFNIGFILGTCALISPLKVNLQLIKFDVPILIGASLLTYTFCLNGFLDHFEGLLLVSSSIFYTFWLIKASKRETPEIQEGLLEKLSLDKRISFTKNSLVALVSVGVLVIGSRFLVFGAVDLAQSLSISDSLIGLTVVAAGTSLPEVATSVMATLRGKADIAVGNVIGSNIFNIMLILGLSSGLNRGLIVSPDMVSIDLLIMVGISIICYPLLVSSKKLVRWEGATLLFGYMAYIAYLISRG